MNFKVLFNMQKELDTKIQTQHNLENEDLIDRKILALLVEIGELANETRCFKFWSLKPPAHADTILEEYVDGIHFILSLGLEMNIDITMNFEDLESSKTVSEQFLIVYEKVSVFKQDASVTNYKTLFEEYLLLGNLLGFTSIQMEKAYISKNEVNHKRQQQGY